MAGSLIKNPGGGLAATGGYIAGTKRSGGARRLPADRTGHRRRGRRDARHDARDVSRACFLRRIWWDKPSRAVSSPRPCSKSSASRRNPRWDDAADRSDPSDPLHGQRISLIAFVQGIQKAAAVDSHVVPEPWDMPGYEHPVIMAAGTFMQGGSLELSADAPIREPYIAYMQGGLTYSHVKLGVLTALQH